MQNEKLGGFVIIQLLRARRVLLFYPATNEGQCMLEYVLSQV